MLAKPIVPATHQLNFSRTRVETLTHPHRQFFGETVAPRLIAEYVRLVSAGNA